jgi:ribonuclease HII
MKRATFRLERTMFADGARTVAGVDEVGRGAWAGPLSVGVFVLDAARLRRFPPGVRDSKVLTPAAREALFEPLSRAGAGFAVGHASNEECDELGMTAAQRLAARRAFEQLDAVPDACILDGNWNFSGMESARPVIDGDATCLAVAAASVLAKVTRDRIMVDLARSHPDYRFERNKGYPSLEHRAAIARLGLTALHRASWSFARPEGR